MRYKKTAKVNPPAGMSAAAKKHFEELAPMLGEIGLLSPLFVDSLAAYCRAFAEYMEMEAFIAKHGRTFSIYDKDGRLKMTQQLPQVGIRNRALEVMRKLAGEFGFTPASMSGLSPEPDPDDEMGEFFS